MMKKHGIKGILLLLVVLFIGMIWTGAVLAQDTSDFDWEQYSFEQLEQIRDGLMDVYSVKLREWALENGNRLIEPEVTELTLYTTQYKTIATTITRRDDTAPERTTLVWTSSDETVARVTSTGAITAVGAGDAVITCTASDDEFIFATVDVHVILPVTSLTIAESQVSLLLSDDPKTAQSQVSVTVAPEDAFNKNVAYKSSNEAVVTVDDEGNLQALSVGNATITVTSLDEFSAYPKTASAYVKVSQAVSEIEVSYNGETLAEGDTVETWKGVPVTLTAKAFPDTASLKTLAWESSDPDVARVSYGTITPVAVGEAEIKALATDGSGVFASVNLKVKQKVTNILYGYSGDYRQINSIYLRADEGASMDILPYLHFLPEDATEPSATLESSDPEILTVDEEGVVTAKKAGQADVIITAADGSGVVRRLKVKVYPY